MFDKLNKNKSSKWNLHSPIGTALRQVATIPNSKWFTILRMSGAVTTGNSGTSALFNNKSISSIGGKKRGKKRKSSKDKRGSNWNS